MFLADEFIAAYFAGRFDGDGSINEDGTSECRIVYSSWQEALIDQKLLERVGITRTSVYNYAMANTVCLYVSEIEARLFGNLLKAHSWKWQQRPTP